MMKAIMYHYVRPFDSEYPNFKNLHIDDFKKQLDYFQDKYGFVSKEDFLNCFKTKTPARGVVLTFDDGLSCHYDFVFQELKKRGLWGIFYIPTQPYVEGKLLDVHRTHLLLGKYDSMKVFDTLNQLFDDTQLDQTKLEEFRKFTYRTQENDQYTLLVKRILNYFIAYEHRERIMDALMQKFIPNEKEILGRYYLKESHLLEIHQAGMVIGSHTVNHPVMSRLNIEDQKFQIDSSFDFLKRIVKQFDHKTFCYPYGGFHSFTDDTERILSAANCIYSFNVEQRDIQATDLQSRPQALPRYDCNQFPFGQVRALNLKED
ncbi:MAG: polysaccharide deacetylase family protein [Bacteroidota bacterium]